MESTNPWRFVVETHRFVAVQVNINSGRRGEANLGVRNRCNSIRVTSGQLRRRLVDLIERCCHRRRRIESSPSFLISIHSHRRTLRHARTRLASSRAHSPLVESPRREHDRFRHARSIHSARHAHARLVQSKPTLVSSQQPQQRLSTRSQTFLLDSLLRHFARLRRHHAHLLDRARSAHSMHQSIAVESRRQLSGRHRCASPRTRESLAQ